MRVDQSVRFDLADDRRFDEPRDSTKAIALTIQR